MITLTLQMPKEWLQSQTTVSSGQGIYCIIQPKTTHLVLSCNVTHKKKKEKNKRAAEKVNCKHLNNTRGELQSRPFSFLVPFLSSPHRLFSTKAVIRRKCAVSGKEKRRENDYPLPQPAGLFINTQL